MECFLSAKRMGQKLQTVGHLGKHFQTQEANEGSRNHTGSGNRNPTKEQVQAADEPGNGTPCGPLRKCRNKVGNGGEVGGGRDWGQGTRGAEGRGDGCSGLHKPVR